MKDKTRILYLDDNSLNIKEFISQFKSWYNISSAVSDEDALNILEKERFDVVIIDQIMWENGEPKLLKNIITEYPYNIIITDFTNKSSSITRIKIDRDYHNNTKQWDRSLLRNTVEKVVGKETISTRKDNFRSFSKASRDGAFVVNYEKQKRAEIELKKLNQELEERVKIRTEEVQKLSQAVIQSPVSVMITDSEGVIEYVNPRFERSTGYKSEEIIGKNPRFLKSGIHDKDFFKTMLKQINSGELWNGEICNRKKDGELFWESVSISPLFDSENNISHFIEVKEDITAKKLMITELKDAKEKAESATKAKSEFLAIMSHEIRTPLNAVIGFIHLLSRTLLNQKQIDYVEKIDISTRSLLGIINNILDFSKIEADKIEIESIDFEVPQLIENLISIVIYKAREKGLKIEAFVDPDIPEVLIGDPLRISQILLNITNNAIKFTEEGSIDISCNGRKLSNNLVELTFIISDTGIGMKPEYKDKLFKPFTQEDSSTTRRYGGSGLGLTISKKLADIMKGTITVESSEGLGSSFTFKISCEVSSAENGKIMRVLSNKSIDSLKLSNIHLLLVDDDDINRQVVQELLEDQGIKVDIASNGKDAYKSTLETEYDLVLMDIHMPVMDGIDSTRLIRKKHCKDELPIVALTADAVTEKNNIVYQAGMNDYVTKPIKPLTLLSVIGKNLNFKKIKSTKREKTINKESINPPNNKLDLDIRNTVFNGDENRYMEFLIQFRKNYSKIINELNSLFKLKNSDGCKMILHKLKGISGNLGSNDLYEICIGFEDAFILDDYNKIKSLLIDLQSELNLIFSEIDILVEDHKDISDKNTGKIDKTTYSYLIELQKMIEVHKLESLDFLNTILVKIDEEGIKSGLNKLRLKLIDYDFINSSKDLEDIINFYYPNESRGEDHD